MKIGVGAFKDCTSLKNVDMSSCGISELDDGMFEGCESLVAVKLPDGVKTICQKAFGGCDMMQRVSIPQSLEEIGDFAF